MITERPNDAPICDGVICPVFFGIEDADDIIANFEQALAAAHIGPEAAAAD